MAADDIKQQENNVSSKPEAPKSFVPELLTVSPPPHMKAPERTRGIMFDVIIAMIPALVWGIYVFGFRALTIVLISVLSCVACELVWQLLSKKPVMIGDLSAVVTGILLGLNFPVGVPLWLPIVGSGFAIIIVKQLFGGIGKNIMNPALAARVFMLISWPDLMNAYAEPFAEVSPFSISVDVTASATPLAALKTGDIPDVPMTQLLLGNTAGAIGEVSALLIIAGGLYLMIRRVIAWQIPVGYIGTVAIIAFILPQTENAVDFMFASILSGGLMLGAFFMATDYTTSPVTERGRLIYGIGCGLITMLIRLYGAYPGGVSFAILIMNTVVWYLDRFTRPVRFGGVTRNGK